MCSGIPVLAHPTPGLTEALGASGWLIDRDDVAMWEKAIRHLAEPGPYASFADLSQARAAELDPTADLNAWCDAIERT